MSICTVVNKYKEPLDIYIGRGSKWGNPFVMANNSDEERNRVCDLYETYFWTTNLASQLHKLKGRRLGCFCKPERCHGDFLAKLVNKLDTETIDLRIDGRISIVNKEDYRAYCASLRESD